MLAGSSVIAQATIVLVSPIITRLYSPADMGAYTVFLSALAVVNSFASMRYERAIPLPKERERGIALLLLSFVLLPVATGLLLILVGFQGAWLSQQLGVAALRPYMWLLAVGLVAIGGYQALTYWFIRENDFKVLAWTRLVQSLNMTGTQILGGFLWNGPLGLLLGGIVGQAAGTTSLVSRLRRQKIHLLSGRTARLVPEVARTYIKFPALTAWTQAVNAAGLGVPVLLLARYYGPEVAGWYALGQRVLASPAGVLGAAVSQVYTGESARLVRDQPEMLPARFKQLTKHLMLFSLPVIAVSLVSPWIFAWVFGKEWRNAGVYAAVLGLPVCCTLVVSSMTSLVTYGFNTWASIWEVARLLATVGILWLSAAKGLSSLMAVICVAAVTVASYVVLWLLNLLAVRELARRAAVMQPIST